MPDDPDLSFVLCTVAGALAVAGGALGALNLAPAVVGVLGIVALLRICWLDDNVANDLLCRDDLPQSYLAAQRRQKFVEALLLGRPCQSADLTPILVATRMHAEAQALTAALLAGGAAILAQIAPFGPGLSAGLALGGFLLALRMADRLTATLWRLECGQALPHEDLLRRPFWTLSSRKGRDR